MAMTKMHREIIDRLERIEQALGIGTGAATLEQIAANPEALAASLDYDSYTAQEVIDRVASLSAEQRAALVDYERSHKNRRTVLEALQ